MAAICYETIGNIISNLFTDNLARMHAHTCKTCSTVHLFRFPKMINVSTPLRAAEHRAQPANTTIYYLPAQAHSTIADTSSSRALKWRRPHGYTRPLRCYQATVAERFVILIKSIITEWYVCCLRTNTPLALALSPGRFINFAQIWRSVVCTYYMCICNRQQ